jgi:hypothetical protein
MSINFHQYDPHPDLIPYIDKYWVLSNDFPKLKQKTILPDGCIDIIFNFGDECITDNGVSYP